MLDVLRVLPALELADLVERTEAGWRLTPAPKPAAGADRG
ncbi:DNA processing protein [Geodermatophilus obscurus]|uniref:DNA processing protein n=1 Tax=Geodermatophilus obscurus TaxID=1861 RepID=A0A1M7UTK7_9ACTN|nr:DNA processing protein [Geodermatophilus obscurus]